jgi:uncharacterized membrane protein
MAEPERALGSHDHWRGLDRRVVLLRLAGKQPQSRQPENGLAGDLWAIHGGGIYHLEKYKLAPPTMPENLHWFKWEAYFTWMSGIALLCVVFYSTRRCTCWPPAAA